MQFRYLAILAAVVMGVVAAPADVIAEDIAVRGDDIEAPVEDFADELDKRVVTQGSCKVHKRGLGRHGSCFIGTNGEHRACSAHHVCTRNGNHCSVSNAPGGQVVCS